MKWVQIWIPRGMQLDVNVDCGCEGEDIKEANVRVFSFCPPPVSHIQKLLRKVRTGCSGKITQKESALASVEPLQSGRSRLPRETAPKGIPLQCQHFVYNLPRYP